MFSFKGLWFRVSCFAAFPARYYLDFDAYMAFRAEVFMACRGCWRLGFFGGHCPNPLVSESAVSVRESRMREGAVQRVSVREPIGARRSVPCANPRCASQYFSPQIWSVRCANRFPAMSWARPSSCHAILCSNAFCRGEGCIVGLCWVGMF